MPVDRKIALSSDNVPDVTCTCEISYHEVVMPDGNTVARWDEGTEIPDVLTFCFGRCARCGLPFQADFTAEEIFDA